MVELAVEAITSAARTGKIGDGKIAVSDLQNLIRVRTGESGVKLSNRSHNNMHRPFSSAGDFNVVADASRPRQRGGGCHPLLAWRFAAAQPADEATSAAKPAAFPPRRGLSAAPLGT